jgi:two-component system, NtrC family, sensor histidine kinase HydH
MEAVSGATVGAADSQRVDSLYQEQLTARHIRADRMFAVLMIAQWLFAIVLAVLVSPYAWAGKVREFHPHLYAAIFLGGAIALFPVMLVVYRPGRALTRHVVVASQMLWSALFIHLTGGRIETHFHVFGSLAFVAFYYDWPLLVTATLVVAGDHLVRGLVYPESVYGIANPEWWRFLEHAGWVAFEDIVLAWSCVIGLKEMKAAAVRQAEVEALKESGDAKAAALEMVLKEMQTSPVRASA